MFSKISLPIQLLIVVSFVLLFGNYIPLHIKNFCFSLSLSIKEILAFVMPFIVFSFIFSCLLQFENKVFLFVGLLLLCVCMSNFLSTLISYGFALVSLQKFHTNIANVLPEIQTVQPLWNFSLPILIQNQTAMIGAFLIGILGSFWQNNSVHKVAFLLRDGANWFLNKCFLPLMPLFILGLILKTYTDSHLFDSLMGYAPIFLGMMCITIAYLFLLSAVSANFQFKILFGYLKNIFPATITAFSSLSSAAAMPFSVKAGEINTCRPQIVKTVIPSTVGIHLIGDSICVPIMGIIVLLAFGKPIPLFDQYLNFSCAFVLAKFAIAAVPMGGMIVMLPVFKSYMGFTPEMLGLMTTLYLVFDAFMTACNTTGNGIFLILFDKVLKKFKV